MQLLERASRDVQVRHAGHPRPVEGIEPVKARAVYEQTGVNTCDQGGCEGACCSECGRIRRESLRGQLDKGRGEQSDAQREIPDQCRGRDIPFSDSEDENMKLNSHDKGKAVGLEELKVRHRHGVCEAARFRSELFWVTDESPEEKSEPFWTTSCLPRSAEARRYVVCAYVCCWTSPIRRVA